MGLFGIGKKPEPVLVSMVAGLLAQALLRYGIDINDDELEALLNAGITVFTTVAAAIYARSKVSPVPKAPEPDLPDAA